MNRRIYLVILYSVTVLICVAALCYYTKKVTSGCGMPAVVSVIENDGITLSGVKIDKEYEVSEFNKVNVDLSVSDVIYKQGDTFSVDFYGNEELVPKVEQSGKTLTIEQKSKKISWGNNFANGMESKVTITVPYDCEVEIDGCAHVGDVNIDDVKFSNATLRADVGNVELKDVVVSGKADIECNVGDIRLTDCTLADLKTKADVGDTKLKGTTFKNVKMTASVGDVKIETPGNFMDYNFDIHSSIGDIHVKGKSYEKKCKIINGGSSYEIEIDSSVGDVKIDF